MSVGIHIASLNVNGCRKSSKRAQLFGLIEQKSINIAFIQETHSDCTNESERQNEWRGIRVFCHGSIGEQYNSDVNKQGGPRWIFKSGIKDRLTGSSFAKCRCT